ncbi:MAG: hypothetical protein IT260_23440 [Saprospiraceae bacterium]|nr:hypothetical protein [Saprospiraceae bacterium]
MQFSLERFFLLLRKRWAESGRMYLLGLAILAGFWALTLSLFILAGNGNQNLQLVMLIMGLIGGGAMFAYHQFQQLSTTPGAIRFLHLPGSHLEKNLVALLFIFGFFLPAAMAVFYVVDLSLVEIARRRWWPDADESPLKILDWHKTGDAIATYGIVTAVFALGSVYFSRSALVKTGAAFFVLGMAILFANFWLPYWLVPHSENIMMVSEMFDKLELHNRETSEVDVMQLPESWKTMFNVFLAVLLPVYCWCIAYVRLREKQA